MRPCRPFLNEWRHSPGPRHLDSPRPFIIMDLIIRDIMTRFPRIVFWPKAIPTDKILGIPSLTIFSSTYIEESVYLIDRMTINMIQWLRRLYRTDIIIWFQSLNMEHRVDLPCRWQFQLSSHTTGKLKYLKWANPFWHTFLLSLSCLLYIYVFGIQ